MNHLSLEILQHLPENLLYPLLIRYITLVRLELLSRELFGKVCGDLVCVRGRPVQYCDGSSGGCDGAGDGEADSSVAACDDEVLVENEQTKMSMERCAKG